MLSLSMMMMIMLKHNRFNIGNNNCRITATLLSRDVVCFRNISVNTLHKGDDDNDNDNVDRDSSVWRLPMRWTVRGSKPGACKMFRTSPDRPRSPPSLLYNGHRVCFPGVKQPGRDVNHIPPYSAEVEEKVEPQLYFPSSSSWPVLGWTLCESIIS